jgi:hypothetical protein
METKTQTKIDNHNREDFLSTVYNNSFDLINLDIMSAEIFVLVDAIRAQQYHKKFPHKKFLTLATISNAKDYGLNHNDFDHLVDDRVHNQIVWPRISIQNCSIILDCIPALKYLTVDELTAVFDRVANLYQPDQIHFRSVACFVDDNRLAPRINQFCNLCPKSHVVKKLVYDSDQDLLEIEMRKKRAYADTH